MKFGVICYVSQEDFSHKCPLIYSLLPIPTHQGLRRFRSWSQDFAQRSSMDNPAASSVDSTQNVTEEGCGERQQQQQQQKMNALTTPNKKLTANHTISEPYLDDDELKPLIYGYLHKLGRNGHWQKRFFETNGERLTYYKGVKRTKALATLDLCKVRLIVLINQCRFLIP